MWINDWKLATRTETGIYKTKTKLWLKIVWVSENIRRVVTHERDIFIRTKLKLNTHTQHLYTHTSSPRKECAHMSARTAKRERKIEKEKNTKINWTRSSRISSKYLSVYRQSSFICGSVAPTTWLHATAYTSDERATIQRNCLSYGHASVLVFCGTHCPSHSAAHEYLRLVIIVYKLFWIYIQVRRHSGDAKYEWRYRILFTWTSEWIYSSVCCCCCQYRRQNRSMCPGWACVWVCHL